MQDWPGSGQTGGDGHGSWQTGFDFADDQNDQYDPNQGWGQSMADGTNAYGHLASQDASTSNFFESAHGEHYLDDLSGSAQAHGQEQNGFQSHGHDSMHLGQFGQDQDPVDSSFHSIPTNLFARQGKPNQANHGHSQPQTQPNFGQQTFAFASQDDQPYESSMAQYPQAQLIPPDSRHQLHTPVQPYESLQQHGNYDQSTPAYARSSRHSPVQQQQQSQQQPQQGYGTAQNYHFQSNGPSAAYNNNPQFQYQQHRQPPFSQAQFVPPKEAVQQQQQQLQDRQSPAPQTHHLQQLHQPRNLTPVQSVPHLAPSGPSLSPVPHPQPSQKQPTEPPAKRKRVTKAVSEADTPEPPILPTDLSFERRAEDVDALSLPMPNDEEAKALAQFAKRNKVAQTRYPSIRGLPFMLCDGTIKLPTPKSYDKLAPMIAALPRSNRRLVPELGYDLPCEIQGRFTTKYQPSPDKGGLDARRLEAKILLDMFDQDMKAMGKRRPKYTEYPHAFKEQLKSDEAFKHKAEKRARMEQEGDQEREKVKLIRPLNRPLNPVEAAAWDMIGFVAIEKSTERSGPIIASRVQQAGDYLITLRAEMNRAKQALDAAIKGATVDLAGLKQDYETKKEALYKAVDATVLHADDSVLDNIGGHQKLILSLINALINCIKANDFSGPLPRTVLELFTHIRITRKMAETTNFDVVRKRFADKGDDEIKEMVAEISAKVKKVLDSAKPDTATGYTGTSAAGRARAGVKAGENASAKRSRDDDTDTRTTKKIAVESGGGALAKKLAHPKASSTQNIKVLPPKTGSSILLGKSRPAARSVPKTAESAKSDSPLSEEKPKVEIKKVIPKIEKPSAPATSSALSGIASLLDSINTPKVEAAAAAAAVVAIKKDQQSDTNETPEQKAKRLRKEERRKLRVTWKPDEDLVETKIFQKDDEEDRGRENNLIRDAADDHAEGMVLKQRTQVEDEEDDDDIEYQPWTEPMLVDLSSLSQEARSKNFVTRGGQQTFASPEQKQIAEREQRELMAIYPDTADIPATPKSPIPENATMPEVKTGTLPEEGNWREIHTRWLDSKSIGAESALFAATSRVEFRKSSTAKLDSILGKIHGPPKRSGTSAGAQPIHASKVQPLQPLSQLPLVVGVAAEEMALAWLKSDKVQALHDVNVSQPDSIQPYHYQNSEIKTIGELVESVISYFLNKPYPATTPPEWLLHNTDKVSEWWFGYNKEMSVRQKKIEEEQARAAAAQANAFGAMSDASQEQGNAQEWAAYYQQQQQAYAPYMSILSQMQTGGQLGQASVQQAPQAQAQMQDGQLQSLLAAINQPGQQPQHAPPPPPPQQQQQSQAGNPFANLNPNDSSYQQLLMLSQMAQGGQVPPPPPQHAQDREQDQDQNREWDHETDRDREWDMERRDDYGRDQNKDGKKKKGLAPHKPANKALIGTKPCTFWQQGKCARGDACTFRHD